MESKPRSVSSNRGSGSVIPSRSRPVDGDGSGARGESHQRHVRGRGPDLHVPAQALDGGQRDDEIADGARPDDQARASLRRGAPHPFRQRLPFRIVARRPEFAAGVEGIAAGVLRQRMREQPALQRLARRRPASAHSRNCGAIAPRSIRRRPQRLEVEQRFVAFERMAVVAAAAAGALFDENRLDASEEKAEIGFCGGMQFPEENARRSSRAMPRL